MEPISTGLLAGIIGLGIGAVIGRITSSADELRDELDLVKCISETRHKRIDAMGLELADLRTFKSRVLAGLQRANAKRKAKAADARHERMDKADTRLSMKQAAE